MNTRDKRQRQNPRREHDNEIERQEIKAPEEITVPETDDYDDSDDIASAEEMEEFIRSRKEKRSASQRSREQMELSEEAAEFLVTDNSMDPYLEPDPTLPKVSYKENLFLSRGCKKCPESYVPVSEEETRSCAKVCACNWMKGIHQPNEKPFDFVEVRFKNNRKEFFRLPDGIDVKEGDIVAVEGIPGHDVGIVSLTGEVCRIQMQRKKASTDPETAKKLFRRAKVNDIERWVSALKDETSTLLKTRHIAEDLGLVMKVNDVEYQGDHSKAIFYYTADDRVDFRDLIKVLAEQFHVRIEMKQIGVRQEAGKVGGIGTCGRELCCSTWLTNFKSVTTGVAKTQQILPNPQKLAGQCGKLKCCLNFEYDVYVDALKNFPPAGTPIRFQKGLALYKKTDVFRGIMWYAYEGDSELYAITADNVKKIIEMNLNQEYPEKLEDYQVELMSTAALAQESSSDEFEQELRRMADDSNASTENTQQRDKGRNDQNRDRRDNRDNRQPRDNRDNRQPRDNRDRRGPREGGDQRNGGPKGENRRRSSNNDRRNDERRK